MSVPTNYLKSLVAPAGLEPARPCGQAILSLTYLIDFIRNRQTFKRFNPYTDQ